MDKSQTGIFFSLQQKLTFNDSFSSRHLWLGGGVVGGGRVVDRHDAGAAPGQEDPLTLGCLLYLHRLGG